jgi:hypothetical protein
VLALLLALTGWSGVAARAQDSVLAGVVLGATTSLPLDGARLTIEGTPLVQTSDANGRFRFAGLTGTQVTLWVVRVGYQPVAVPAPVGQSDMRIVLREASVKLDEIVVTGQPEGIERRAVGNSIATIDAPAALELSGPGDVAKLINHRGRHPAELGQGGRRPRLARFALASSSPTAPAATIVGQGAFEVAHRTRLTEPRSPASPGQWP